MNLSVEGDEVGFSDGDGENNTLTIAAGSTTSNELTITPKDNDIDEPDRERDDFGDERDQHARREQPGIQDAEHRRR